MYILFPLRDVRSCTLSSLMLLLVSLLFLLVYLLRFIGVVQNPMVFFFLAFIHRILLDLGLDYFPAFELVHIIARIGATFLKQRAAQLKASSKRPYIKSSIGNASLSPPSSDPSAKAYMDPTAIVDPPPSTSSDSSLRTMLDTILTIQAAHGQHLLDVLNEITALRAKLAIAKGSTPPAPPSNES